MKHFSSFLSWCSSRRPAPSFTAPSAPALAPSCSTETRKSAGSAGRLRPSLFGQAFFLCLLVAGYLSLRAEGETPDPRLAGLLGAGWQWRDGLPCPGLAPGHYYEVTGEEGAGEFFYLGGEQVLAPAAPFPEAPRRCAEIPEPSRVEEL